MSQNRTHGQFRKLNFEDADEKRAYNRRLFDVVAPSYQRVTAVLSFGQDRRWKRSLIGLLPNVSKPVCADLACGTGDLLRLLRERYPDGRIVGIDLNQEMMIAGRETKDGQEHDAYIKADMNALPLPDASTDIVTGGYAVRNAPDLNIALKEIARVLRPGGVAAFLDFSRPASKAASRAELAVLRIWGRIWGNWFHRDGDVYGYIAESLAHYPDRKALTAKMASVGLETVSTQQPFLGFLELRLVRKERGHFVDGTEGNGLHGKMGRD